MADFTITLSTQFNAKFTVYSFATQTQATYTFNGAQTITLPAGKYAIVGQSTGSQNFYPVSYNGTALSTTSGTPTEIFGDATLSLNNTGGSSTMSWYYFQLATSQISVDLSTLSGWNNVSSGSHTLKVKAKATGYQDSALSEGASFVKAGSGYTGTVLTTDGYMPADIYIDRTPTGESDTPDYSIFGNDSYSFSCSEYFYMLDWTFDVQNINSYSGCTYERVNGQTFGASNAYGYKVFPTENGWTFNVRFED